MKPHLPILLVLATAMLPAGATILLSDDFSDGNRTTPAWYYGQGAAGTTLTTNGARQNLYLNAASTSNAQVWTTFATTSINPGETLSVTFSFDASGGALASADDGPFRVGLFNVASPVTADKNSSIADSNWNGATGYGAFVDIHAGTTIDTTPESTLRQRTLPSETLWAGAASTAFTTTVAPPDSSLFIGSTANLETDALRYLVTFSLTRTGADSMDLFFQMRDSSNNILSTLTATDGSGTVTSFNTFSLFTGTVVGQDFAIDNVVVSVVPEPSVLLGVSLAPLLLLLRRRP